MNEERCGAGLVEGLCIRMQQEGEDDPSEDCVREARRWEGNPTLIRLACRRRPLMNGGSYDCVKCPGCYQPQAIEEMPK